MLVLSELTTHANWSQFLLQAPFLGLKQHAAGTNTEAKKTPDRLGGGKLWLITARWPYPWEGWTVMLCLQCLTHPAIQTQRDTTGSSCPSFRQKVETPGKLINGARYPSLPHKVWVRGKLVLPAHSHHGIVWAAAAAGLGCISSQSASNQHSS